MHGGQSEDCFKPPVARRLFFYLPFLHRAMMLTIKLQNNNNSVQLTISASPPFHEG